MAAVLGMPPGSEWVIVWTPREVARRPSVPFLVKRASDDEGTAHEAPVPFDDAKTAEGFTFLVLGRVVKRPSTFAWRFEPTGGLPDGLTLEVWQMEVPISPGLRAVRNHYAGAGDQLAIEVIGDTWEDEWKRDPTRVRRALKVLSMTPTRPGPKKGTGAKYATPAEWRTALNEKVRPKKTVATADDATIALWLDISIALLYQLMDRWGPKTLAEIREGRF